MLTYNEKIPLIVILFLPYYLFLILTIGIGNLLVFKLNSDFNGLTIRNKRLFLKPHEVFAIGLLNSIISIPIFIFIWAPLSVIINYSIVCSIYKNGYNETIS